MSIPGRHRYSLVSPTTPRTFLWVKPTLKVNASDPAHPQIGDSREIFRIDPAPLRRKATTPFSFDINACRFQNLCSFSSNLTMAQGDAEESMSMGSLKTTSTSQSTKSSKLMSTILSPRRPRSIKIPLSQFPRLLKTILSQKRQLILLATSSPKPSKSQRP